MNMTESEMSTHMDQLLASCNGVDDLCPRKNVLAQQAQARFLQVTKLFIMLHMQPICMDEW
jgi:hypothetical protein